MALQLRPLASARFLMVGLVSVSQDRRPANVLSSPSVVDAISLPQHCHDFMGVQYRFVPVMNQCMHTPSGDAVWRGNRHERRCSMSRAGKIVLMKKKRARMGPPVSSVKLKSLCTSAKRVRAFYLLPSYPAHAYVSRACWCHEW